MLRIVSMGVRHANSCVLASVVAGAAVGAFALYDKPTSSFLIASAQAGLSTYLASYFLPEASTIEKSAVVGLVMATVCGGLQGFAAPSCAKYGIGTAIVAYGAMTYIASPLQKQLEMVAMKNKI